MIDPQPLKGKAAIVTGAGGGIGRAYARGLAEAGAAVVLADINAGPAQAAADELVSDGFEALALRVDVTDEASVNAMAQETAERFGSVDILVNNAASRGPSRFPSASRRTWWAGWFTSHPRPATGSQATHSTSTAAGSRARNGVEASGNRRQ